MSTNSSELQLNIDKVHNANKATSGTRLYPATRNALLVCKPALQIGCLLCISKMNENGPTHSKWVSKSNILHSNLYELSHDH